MADIVSKPAAGTALTPGTSTPGETRQSFGGVGRNVAEGVARVLGVTGRQIADEDDRDSSGSISSTDRASVTLVSAVGADDAGKALVASCEEGGVDATETVEVGGHPGQARGGGDDGGGGQGAGTASYVAMLGDDGDLVAAVADMRIFERMTPVRGNFMGGRGCLRIWIGRDIFFVLFCGSAGEYDSASFGGVNGGIDGSKLVLRAFWCGPCVR